MQDFKIAEAIPPDASTREALTREIKNSGLVPPDASQELIDEIILESVTRGTIYLNDEYQVMVYRPEDNVSELVKADSPPITHLSIKRLDKEPIHDWRKLQQIKNMILGKDVEAVELYPNEERLVDSANQYHLWALPAGLCFPLGFTDKYVTDGAPDTGAKQRKHGGE